MVRKSVTVMVLAGFVFAPALLAEEQDSGRKGRKRGHRMRNRGADPTMALPALTKRLKLDENQQAQIKPIVEDYQAMAKDVLAKTPQDVKEKRRQLMMDMRAARKSDDKQKAAEIGKQIRELRKSDPATAELVELRKEALAKIEPTLREDQKQALQKMTRGPKSRRQVSIEDSPGFLRRCLMEIDLRPEQKTELKKIDQEYKEASKGLGKEGAREKRDEMGKQYCQEVMKVLDERQKQELQALAQKGPAALGPMMRPRALEQALEHIQLRPDQQSKIDAIKQRYQTDRQAAGKDRRAQADLGRKVVQEVMGVLDDEQKKELAKHARAKGRKGGEGRKGRRSRGPQA